MSDFTGTDVCSEDGLYRYRLEHITGDGYARTLAVLMVNPSKARADKTDPTMTRVRGFANRLMCGRVIVGNEFAYSTPYIKELGALPLAVAIGPENDKHIEQILRDADEHIVAWGPLAKLPKSFRKRWQDVVRIANRVGCKLHCLGTAADGHPRHPLMLAANTECVPWNHPWFPNQEGV